MINISLSDDTKAFCQTMLSMGGAATHGDPLRPMLERLIDKPLCDLDALLAILTYKAQVGVSVPLQQQFNVCLLTDLNHALKQNHPQVTASISHKPREPSAHSFLLASGVLMAAFEGFDGIATMLGLIPGFSGVAILAMGTVAACFSILVYHGLELIDFPALFGRAYQNDNELMNALMHQVRLMKQIRQSMRNVLDEYPSPELIVSQQKILEALEHQLAYIKAAKEQFMTVLQGTLWLWLKRALSSAVVMLCFASGFFTGQTLGLVLASVASFSEWMQNVLIWGSALMGGLSGVVGYLVEERHHVERLVYQWAGLDVHPIEEDLQVNQIEKQQQKIQHLVCRTKKQLGFMRSMQTMVPQAASDAKSAPLVPPKQESPLRFFSPHPIPTELHCKSNTPAPARG